MSIMQKHLTLTLLISLIFATEANGNNKGKMVFYSESEYQEAVEKGKKLIDQAYIKKPDIKTCQVGQVTDIEKQQALDELNRIRQVHGLDPVSYNKENDKYTSASALINAANRTLGHYPPKTAKCYSEYGRIGSKNSNLYISLASSTALISPNFAEDTITNLLIDEGVEGVGHRAWLLNPFLKSISYGRATDTQKDYIDAASVYIDDTKTNLSPQSPDYIAYPYKNYKESWFTHGWYSSFSVIVNKSDFWANKNVDYTKAKVLVTDLSGKALKISHLKPEYKDKRYAGLPNLLTWKIHGTQNNQKYMVKISGVKVDGVIKNYEYWFEIIK